MPGIFDTSFRKRWRQPRSLARSGMILVYLLLLTLMLPRKFRLDLRYEIGKSWLEEDISAPFDFPIYKDPDSLQAEQDALERQVYPIFLRDSSEAYFTSSLQRVTHAVDVAYQQFGDYVAALEEGDTLKAKGILEDLLKKTAPGTTPEEFRQFERGGRHAYQLRILRYLVERIYEQGYLIWNEPNPLGNYITLRVSPTVEQLVAVSKLINGPGQIENLVDGQIANRSQAERQFLSEILSRNLLPNLQYSSAMTQAERLNRRRMASPVFGKVKAGQTIIRKNEIVDQQQALKLQSLMIENEKSFGTEDKVAMFISQFLVVVLITAVLILYLQVNRPRLYFDNQKLALILFTFLITVGTMVLASRLNEVAAGFSGLTGSRPSLSFIYLAPACIVPIFMTNFFGLRTGFLTNLMLAFYGAVLIAHDLEYAFVQIVAGTIAVYSLRRMRKREVFFYTLIYILLAYSVAFVLYDFYAKGSLGRINYYTLLLFVVNVAATIIAYNLIYLLERLFGVTSDLTYLELLDTNHPLIKELARKAPGTFQHSLQVANIAEAAVAKVGGRALLTHVGALYHDIGKTFAPQIFIENFVDVEGLNPHSKMTYEESAKAIINHVPAGVELGHKHRLPREIIDFIHTHHGTTRVEYFYRSYLADNPNQEVDEDSFRYPGPKPFSRETAVLMISDSVEAASRTLNKPTPEKLKSLVNKIIDSKIEGHQLENSNLTFKDITTLRSCIYLQLVTIYHGRIEYPEEVPPIPASERA